MQIVTGIVLAMHYVANTQMAFDSVERIMRDVDFGWLIRNIHANGASMFFLAVYIHMFRGLYYGSYKSPREVIWILGVVIYLLMMATAFMGYVLPWGQMSFHGSAVITNLIGAIPLVGDTIKTYLMGGPAIGDPTLNRFFSLHYLLPFVIAGIVVLHIWALHVPGNNNPTGVSVKDVKKDTVPFHPYYTVKDGFAIMVFFILFAAFVFFMPNALGHADNFIQANPAADAGAHRAGMVPAAVLRDPARHHVRHRPDRGQAARRVRDVRLDPDPVRRAVARYLEGALDALPPAGASSSSCCSSWPSIGLGFCGANDPDKFVFNYGPDKVALVYTEAAPARSIREVSDDYNALDRQEGRAGRTGPQRSVRSRSHSEGFKWLWLSQILGAYYFLYFLVILPVLGIIEKPKARPPSIAESVPQETCGAGSPAAACGCGIGRDRCASPNSPSPASPASQFAVAAFGVTALAQQPTTPPATPGRRACEHAVAADRLHG